MVINNNESRTEDILLGMPQGSILGPFFIFNVYK